ncbi:MAG: hypothetical protein JXR66_03260 [Bacteroidales bacterium]|nr:hypothetical protein [Bacteroidales bacterium]MBN2632548.1 hypothetical protein [Bacteroidales bacterium]
MKKIFYGVIIILAFSCIGVVVIRKIKKPEARRGGYERLRECFINPSPEARPRVYWWCLNGNIDTVRARQEFMEMVKSGIGGFDLFEIGLQRGDTSIPGGPAFLSDESVQTIGWVVDVAGKMGLTVGLNVSSSWNAGGTWVEPVNGGKSLYLSKTVARGDLHHQSISIPFPEISFPENALIGGTGKPMIPFNDKGKPVYYEDIALLAFPAGIEKESLDTSLIIDVTPFFDTETDILQWETPPGEWEICRFVCSNSGQQLVLPSPESAGLAIDHFDSSAVAMHMNYVINRLKPVLGDFRNTALKSLYLASYEARGFVWTSSMATEFARLNGYRIEKFLPLFFEPQFFEPGTVEKIRTDFKKTLSELMINNLYVNASNICNRHGLKLNCEAGGPGYPLYNGPAEPLRALGAVDIPRGEFWVNHSRFYTGSKGDTIDILRVVKEVSAASHIYNRKIVEEEAFTSFQHWQEGPFDIKPPGDRAFCEGMNRVVFHGFSHNIRGAGYPGFVYSAGTHFNDKRVWWPKAKPFIEYVTRLSALFQEAHFVADVLWYYGDKVPNSATPRNTHFKVGPGYDYEVINTDILLNDLSVNKGKLVLSNGARFSVLAVEDEPLMVPAVADKLERLARQGAVIVGEHGGKIFAGTRALDLLVTLKIPPDLDYDGKETFLIDFIHYRLDETDVYFIVNTSGKWISRLCRFRQEGRVPEMWDPVSGAIIPVSVYEQDDHRINMPVTLAPYGSQVIVFRKGRPSPHFKAIKGDGLDPPLMRFTTDGLCLLQEGTFELEDMNSTQKFSHRISSRVITGPWEVSFDRSRGGPDKVIFNELISWTESDDEGIKYYSGTATYSNSFELDAGFLPADNEKIFLDLGNISSVGEVWLNGRHLGITWAEPYLSDVTGIIKEGGNKLVVEISNTWSNRLKGDALTNGHYTNTNIRNTIIPGKDPLITSDQKRVPWAEVPLIRSGLLGRVSLTKYQLIRYK